MELKVVKLYGVMENVKEHEVTRRFFSTFTIKTDNGSYDVIVRTKDVLSQTDITYCDLEDGKKFYVRGIEVSEGVVMAIEVELWGRYCEVCGKWHTEGYWVGECEYACSEECAIKLYGGDEAAFRADLALLDDEATADSATTYWTEWEN